ncbi:MAG: hypothetical protein ACT4OE_00430 [Sphingosinicella sp.]
MKAVLRTAVAVAAFAFAQPAAALPQIDLPEGFSAILDLRVAGADGERSWLDGGFGKGRFGSRDGDFDFEPALANAQLIWRPSIAWNVDGHLAIAAQHGQDQPVDVTEAYLRWRPVPRSATRFAARAGLFWPPVSMEHEGEAWSVRHMLTPSAISSWIGEEVKVVGLEASAVHDLGGPSLAATIGLFGFNDTAATLLSFRGWALHDQVTTVFSRQRLPPLRGFMRFAQAPRTRPTIELDSRPGFYGRLALQGAGPISLEAFYYANRGDPEAVNDELQWGWDTEFVSLGARLDLGENTRIIAQGLIGDTRMGFALNGVDWVETDFRSAYVRLTHDAGPVTFSGRLDLFDTDESGRRMDPAESEQGWALAAAAEIPLTPQLSLLVEGLHIDSERGSRARIGLAPEQSQTVVQAALRLVL